MAEAVDWNSLGGDIKALFYASRDIAAESARQRSWARKLIGTPDEQTKAAWLHNPAFTLRREPRPRVQPRVSGQPRGHPAQGRTDLSGDQRSLLRTAGGRLWHRRGV